MAGKMRWKDGFIAVDWGTTNRRAYRIGADSKCVDEFEDAKGILTVEKDGFPGAVAEIRDRLGDHPLLLAGMIGSNRGWKEAPYVPCSAGIDDLTNKLVWVDENGAIVPGVSYLGDNRADVMRGEEVQLLGAVVSGSVSPGALVCHPGTHNKWVQLCDGKIQSFRTVMTGELFSLLKEHSILADLLKEEVAANDAFREGARHGFSKEDLPAELFSIRARVLLDQARREDAASYASGLMIGSDVRIGLEGNKPAEVFAMGRPELTALYSAALAEAGVHTIELDGERSFLAGIARIAEKIS